MFKKLKVRFLNNNQKLNLFHYVASFLLLISFSIPFFAGIFSSETKLEELSNYISNKTIDSTQNGKIMSIGVTSTPQSGGLPNDETEFYNLYCMFEQESATFASGYNIYKNETVKFPDLDKNGNYSIFYSAKDATVSYKGHYKHWYYPVEFMFPAERLYDICRYMIYISQSQANILLAKKGYSQNELGNYTDDDYKSLIKEIITCDINGISYECIIGNVFYETNYYYDALSETFDNFIICAYFFPGSLSRTNVYFFNKFPYQNLYFMNYINNVYKNKLYNVEVVRNNIKDSIDYEYVTSFYYSKPLSNNVILTVLLIASFVLILLTSFINIVKKLGFNYKYYSLIFISFIIPYLVFFLVAHFSKSILLLSDFSIRIYIYLLLFYFLLNLLTFAIKKVYFHYQKRKRLL